MQDKPEIAIENINRFACDQCGANMIYDPRYGKLNCPYCSHKIEIINEDREIAERDFYSFLRPENERLQPMALEAMQVSCESCAATVTFVPPETARNCDFCGAKIVAQPKAADPLVAPEGVLPFSVTNQDASAALKSWINSRWFAPGNLKIFAQPDKISSIYLPYWTFDALADSNYSGERGDYYYETEYYKENNEKKSRQVRHTRWHYASGAVSRFFDDIYIAATKSVVPKYLNKLNWQFKEIVPYEPAYLAGHKAQTYQKPLEEGFEEFKQIAAAIIYNDVRHDIGGDDQRVSNIETSYSNVTFKHLLLPVYAGAYRYQNKVFQIVVNGRTGEVQGERPYSWIKIAGFVISLLAVIMIIVLILSATK